MNGKTSGLSAVTRRRAVAALLAAPVIAQTPAPPPSTVPPQGVPAPPSPTGTEQTRREKAQADIQKASESLRKISIPMDLEPAFAFSALT